MTKKYSTKKALVASLLSLVLCFSMLIGTTFAWFTDSVTSANNIIMSGNLDVELYYQLEGETTWTKVTETTNVFKEDTLWEPGHTEVVKLKVVNEGSLALKYNLGVNVASEVGSVNVNDVEFKLSDFIKFGIVDGAQSYTRDQAIAAAEAAGATALKTAYNSSTTALDAKNDTDSDEKIVTMVVYMPTTVGNEANPAKGAATPTINLGINLFATQQTAESDSFDNQYDAGAEVVIASGTSNDISWTLTEAGTLAISGDSVISAADIQSLSAYASQITNVKIGSSITEIGEEAFRGLSISAVTFEDNAELQKIGTNAFRDCVVLETVEIPASVETIGEKAFQGCASLETLTFDANSQLKTVGAGKNAFANCTSLKSVVLPDSVETIGVACFYGCTSLETVVLGDNVTSIGVSAFENSGVTAFEVPSALTVIPNNMLKNTKITTITVGDQVTTVNPGAFENCTELKTAYIGSATIKESVFAGCSNLETVIFANVTNLDGWAFMNCTNLKTVVINAENNLTLGYNTYTTGAKANWYGNTYYSATGNVITYIASAIDGVYSEQCENCLLGHGWNDGTADGTDILAYTNGGTFANDTTFADGTLATPTKTGYVFGGWYTESDFSGTAVTTAAAGQIYYAKWIAE